MRVKTKTNMMTAALKTYIIWAWLEKNPDKWKADYPLYDKLRLWHELCDCAWCSLYNSFMGDGCPGCPLAEEINGCCVDDSSLYKNYLYLKRVGINCTEADQIIRRCAGNIARIAWAEYKRLGG